MEKFAKLILGSWIGIGLIYFTVANYYISQSRETQNNSIPERLHILDGERVKVYQQTQDKSLEKYLAERGWSESRPSNIERIK